MDIKTSILKGIPSNDTYKVREEVTAIYFNGSNVPTITDSNGNVTYIVEDFYIARVINQLQSYEAYFNAGEALGIAAATLRSK